MIEQVKHIAQQKHEAGEPLPAAVHVHDFQDAVDYFYQLTTIRVGGKDCPAQAVNMRVMEDKFVPAGEFRVYDGFDKQIGGGKIGE